MTDDEGGGWRKVEPGSLMKKIVMWSWKKERRKKMMVEDYRTLCTGGISIGE